MSDELPGTCCMCGGTSGIVYARAVDNSEIEAICRSCYPDRSPPQIARLIQENAKLRDLLKRMYNNIDLWSFGKEVAEAIGPLPGEGGENYGKP